MNSKYTIAAVLVLVLTILAPGLKSVARAQDNTTLLVFAAASLTDAFAEIGHDFEAAHPGVQVIFNFGGSSTLAAQIDGGAPADVFASANARQMDVAVQSGRVDEDALHTFVYNHLVLAVPVSNPAHIESLHDLANPGVLLILAAPDVPVRVYTDSMLQTLTGDADYGPEFVTAVMDNLVSEETNVRQVVAKLVLGEADAGIVYSSDVTPDTAPDLSTLPIPEGANPLASYPIAALNDSPHPEQASAFVDFVLSDAGQVVLKKWGFLPLCAAAPGMEATPEATSSPESTETPNTEAGANACS